jgi:hypothetical protein
MNCQDAMKTGFEPGARTAVVQRTVRDDATPRDASFRAPSI